jgi:large subunit ribosomal protein L22
MEARCKKKLRRSKMKIKAELKYLRIAPRKVRLVAKLIRKKKVEQAQTTLDFAIKKGTRPISKLLDSAVASAKNNFQLDPSNLYISKITVDEGPKFKRWRPRSRGMAYPIQKKTSHVTIVLDEIVEGKKIKKAQKPAKPTEIEEKRVVKEKPKFEPKREMEKSNPKQRGGLKRFFRRKSV